MLMLWYGHDVHAQSEVNDLVRLGHAGFVATVITDYQSVGINPANLGFAPKHEIYSYSTPLSSGSEHSKRPFAFTVGEGGLSLRSDALTRTGMIDLLLQRGSAVAFTDAEKARAANDFAGKGLRFDAEVMLFGASFQHRTLGGVALSVRERMNGAFVLNNDAAKLMFQGRHSDYFDSTALNWKGDTIGYSRNPKNFSKLFDGTILSMTWLREFALSYGVNVYSDSAFAVYVGATPKFFQSYAYLEAQVQNGDLFARSALSPYFAINYGKATTPSAIAGNALVPVGKGYGFDVGVTLKYLDWSFAASLVDYGRIHYNGNVFSAGDTILNGLGSTGFDSYNLFKEAPKITGEGQYFRWQGLMSTSTELPARLHMGVSREQNKRWSYGMDYIHPLNNVANAMKEPLLSSGVSWRPYFWLYLGMGLSYGANMGVAVPTSIMTSLFGGRWQIGISTINIATIFSETNPVVSFATGFARIRL